MNDIIEAMARSMCCGVIPKSPCDKAVKDATLALRAALEAAGYKPGRVQTQPAGSIKILGRLIDAAYTESGDD